MFRRPELHRHGGQLTKSSSGQGHGSTGTQGQSAQTSIKTSGKKQRQWGASVGTSVSGSIGANVSGQGGDAAEIPCSGDQSSTGATSSWTTPDYKHGVLAGSVSATTETLSADSTSPGATKTAAPTTTSTPATTSATKAGKLESRPRRRQLLRPAPRRLTRTRTRLRSNRPPSPVVHFALNTLLVGKEVEPFCGVAIV